MWAQGRCLGLALAACAVGCARAPLGATEAVCLDDHPDTDAAAPSLMPCTTFTRDRSFDGVLSPGAGASHVAGVVGAGAADLFVAVDTDFAGRIARWDGAAWANETLPADVFTIRGLTMDAAGEPWALVDERGPSRSGVGGPAALLHRRGGVWVVERAPAGVVGALGGTRSGLFLGTGADATGDAALWRRRANGWHEDPLTLSSAEAATHARFGTTGFWGGPCGQAVAFGGGLTADSLFGTMFRLDGDGWVAVPVPVLSDFVSVSGPSVDALTVIALDRNSGGDSHFFRLTGGLATWTPLPTPASVDYAAVWSPSASRAVAVGCEWADKFHPPAPDCARVTTLDGDTISTQPLAGVEGIPTTLWFEPATGALHLFTTAPDPFNLLRAQHYAAPPTCP